MFQVFFCEENNILNKSVADVSEEHLIEFCEGKIVTKIIRH